LTRPRRVSAKRPSALAAARCRHVSPSPQRRSRPRPYRLPFQIVTSCPAPPDGEGWLHEIKHDGHRLLAIVDGDDLKLISRNGHDRTPLFREPFDKLVVVGLPPLARGCAAINSLAGNIKRRRGLALRRPRFTAS
jgi:ATP-dependent DNA ligase